MKFLNGVWGFVKNLGVKNYVIIAGVVALISLFYLNRFNYNRYLYQKQETFRVTANLNAANDTIRVTKNKVGQSEFDKLAYLGTVKQLSKEKNDLVEEIKKVKGDVKVVVKTNFKIVHDTTKLIVTADTINGILVVNSKYDTTYSEGNFRKIGIKHFVDLSNYTTSGYITKDEIGFSAVTGLKKTDLGYEIFVTPDYPGMTLTGLKGAVVDPRLYNTIPKRKQPLFSVGASLIYAPVNYDLFHKKMDFTQRVVLGVGLTVNLIPLLSKF